MLWNVLARAHVLRRVPRRCEGEVSPTNKSREMMEWNVRGLRQTPVLPNPLGFHPGYLEAGVAVPPLGVPEPEPEEGEAVTVTVWVPLPGLSRDGVNEEVGLNENAGFGPLRVAKLSRPRQESTPWAMMKVREEKKS